MPQIKVIELQGTYLLWLDCTALGLSDEELEKLTLGADLYLDEGYLFGPVAVALSGLIWPAPRGI